MLPVSVLFVVSRLALRVYETGMHKTIFAFATPEGRSALSVLRLSGPHCRDVAERLAGQLPQPREGRVRKLRDPASGDLIDEALVFWIPGPGSFTGEDCLEFHVHGSRAVRSAMIDVLGREPNCALAEPGEFTRRAFENGKADIAKLEGLADLLAAETQTQRRLALVQFGGMLDQQTAVWRGKLLSVMALLEASIDFVDEGDVAEDVLIDAEVTIAELREHLRGQLSGLRSAEVIRDGYKVAIAGPPNVGKSSLINALSRRDVAIVTEFAGTTRDILEVPLELDGMLVRFFDTAGIRVTDDPVERIGVERAIGLAGEADLVLWLCSGDEKQDRLLPSPSYVETLRVRTKADLFAESTSGEVDIEISAHTGHGLRALIAEVAKRAKVASGNSGSTLIANARQAQCVAECLEALDRVGESLSKLSLEIVCEELRRGNDALARLGGRIEAEEVLGAIFSRFCIGK